MDLRERSLTIKPGTARYRKFRLMVIEKVILLSERAGYVGGPFSSEFPKLATALDWLDLLSEFDDAYVPELSFPEGAD